jgi:transcription initiation factor TFIIH subunit 4
MVENVFELIKTETRGFVDRIYAGAVSSSLSPSLPNIESNDVPDSATWACQAIFQSLSSLSQCMVMRILFIAGSLTLKELRLLTSDTHSFRIAMRELTSLWILLLDEATTPSDAMDIDDDDTGNHSNSSSSSGNNNGRSYRLHDSFRRGLHRSLVGARKPWSQFMQEHVLVIDRSPPSIQNLQQHCRWAWNEVLGYLVKLVDAKKFAGTSIERFVRDTGLLVTIRSEETRQSQNMITSKGYEYMLKDYAQQVWDFLQFVLLSDGRVSSASFATTATTTTTIATSSAVVVDSVALREETLSLVFALSYCTVGQACPIAALTAHQRRVVGLFADAGIVYMRSASSQLFYPTPTAVNMLFGSRGLASMTIYSPLSNSSSSSSSSSSTATSLSLSAADDGALQVIVETNFQVVAYVSSDLHLALLQLFVLVTLRMPNMAFGRLHRDKVKDAFKAGITANQIVTFLEHHAHPVVRRQQQHRRTSTASGDHGTVSSSSSMPPLQKSTIPSNILDQLRLWEEELMRVHSQVGLYFDGSAFSRAIFDELLVELQQRQCVLWSNAAKKELVVTADSADFVRNCVRTASKREMKFFQ